MSNDKQADRAHWVRQRDAAKLEAALGTLPKQRKPPTLVVLSGLPGSGKSHFAQQLARRIGAVVLDSDALRQVLFANPQHSQEEHGRLFPAIHALIERLLERGISVIVDATNLKEANRKPYYQIAEKHGAKCVLVRVWAPKGVIRQRLALRDAGNNPADRSTATMEVYERMRKDAEPIRRRHVSVDTSKDMTEAVDKVILQLSASKA